MKFKIQREAFLKPLQQVIGVVERRQTLPVLSNILLVADDQGITLTATDLEVELHARVAMKVGRKGEITVPARKLFDICRTLPDQAQLEVEVDQERATVRSGKSRFVLSTLPAAEFPAVEEVNSLWDITVEQRLLKQLIDKTHFAMAQQDVRYYLNGLLLEVNGKELRAVATDGHRLALAEISVETTASSPQQVIMPRKGIQELLRLLEDAETPAQVLIGSNHVRIVLPETRFTSKLIDGKFPDYQKVIPKTNSKSVLANREGLKQALTRTSILSNEKYRGVRLTLAPNSLRIQSHNPEQEEAEEELEVNYQGEQLEIGFNVNYLLDAVNVLSTPEIQALMHDSNSSCLIQAPNDPSSRYIVMPMRL
jgi:DNA polymerase III subunit beta